MKKQPLWGGERVRDFSFLLPLAEAKVVKRKVKTEIESFSQVIKKLTAEVTHQSLQ